jgi:hypothetical protein
MLKTKEEILITEQDGTVMKKRVAVETPATLDNKKGEKRNKILSTYSISDQINILRKAVLTGDLTELKAMDDAINAIISK